MYFNKLLNRAFALACVAIFVAACGGGGGSTIAPFSAPGTPILNSLPAPPAVANELRVYVDAGPELTDYQVNRLYTDVTICYPGKSSPGSPTQCQTIDHVLVDTGSTGLRLLSSVMAPALSLNRLPASSGLPLLNCVQFVDNNSAWGPVVRADIVMGGKIAANVPVQVIGDPAFDALAAATSCNGNAITTAKALGANGILGVGLLAQDCGAGCVVNPHNGLYYTCTDARCNATKGAAASLDQQVKHPVPLFAADNNGIVIELPAAIPGGEPSLNGSLFFGIGTRSNNQLVSATGAVLTTNVTGYITAQLGLQNLTKSFVDSGSNGLFFDSTISKCGIAAEGFYCPSSPISLSATLVGANGATSLVSFSVDNALTLFASRTDSFLNHVFPTLAGDIGDARIFDFGLPFFYGRRVFFGIEDKASTLGTGPFVAL